MQNIFTQGNGMGGMGFRPMNFRPVMTLGQQAVAKEEGTAALQPVDGIPGAVPITTGPVRIKPGPERTPLPADQRKILPYQRKTRDPLQWSLNRICKIMTKVQQNENVEPETKGHLFWSYAKHSKNEAAFLKSYAELCPGLPVPEKPVKPETVLVAESADKIGFHGKTQISYAEAKELMVALEEVLRPLTPEESASELAKETCLRDFTAGNFPIVEELQSDLADFVAAGDTGATFEISKGQVIVAGKAIDCAVALGRGKAIKTALTVGGIGAGAGLLWLLLL